MQINFVAASALAFVILELGGSAISSLIIVAADRAPRHRLGPVPRMAGSPATSTRRSCCSLYITTVVTISVIIAVAVYYAFWTAEQAEAETETLLHRVLPVPVAERLKARPDEPISDSFGDAAILFSDLAGFVPIARSLGAARTVAMLNRLVQASTGWRPSTAWRRSRPSATPTWPPLSASARRPDNAAPLARMSLDMQAIADAVGDGVRRAASACGSAWRSARSWPGSSARSASATTSGAIR